MKFLLMMLLALNNLMYAADSYEDDLSAEEAYKMEKSGEAIIVDVRTTIEYLYTGHGEGFINIPAYNWTYEPKSIEDRVKSAEYELEKGIVKDVITSYSIHYTKLYDPIEPTASLPSRIIGSMTCSITSWVILK